MTSPHRPPAASTEPGRPRDRRRQITALRGLAAERAGVLRTGEDWEAWLRLAARLGGQNFTNVMLIAAQRPEATLVASYQQWQARGRRIRKGEPGIQILLPPRQLPARPRTGAPPASPGPLDPAGSGPASPRLGYVWDIAQTSGPAPGGEVAASPGGGGAPVGLWDALTWLARREGFTVDRAGGGAMDGVPGQAGHRIEVSPDLDSAGATLALLHELGHILARPGPGGLPCTGTGSRRCSGILKVEADSVEFIVAASLGIDPPARTWPSVTIWAGTDPRARPRDIIMAAGNRITTAASVITAHLETTLPALIRQRPAPARATGQTLEANPIGEIAPAQPVAVARASARPVTPPAAAVGGSAGRDVCRVLADAERFYRASLTGGWAPAYLAARGLDVVTVGEWGIGYAPAGWTTLISHLREAGHADAVIEAAGLARRSSRGTLIDHFRDRVMFPVRDESGAVAGFIGRAGPEAGVRVPKYLNSPETAAYAKGSLLFGLHEARGQLIAGAMPVIAEGPFDAIAITAASPGEYAGLAPCGTALTSRQAAVMASVADPGETGVLVALDGDRAGREAAIRAYSTLLPVTAKIGAVVLPPGRDPASIYQDDGPAALREALQRTEPLARLVIDAHLDEWSPQLDHAEGRINAMRSAAVRIAAQLPPGTAEAILRITGGRDLATLDEHLRPVASGELPAIARVLPPGPAIQIARVADRLATDYSDVTAEVANAVSRQAAIPKRSPVRCRHDGPGSVQPARSDGHPALAAATGFPSPIAAVSSTSPSLTAGVRRSSGPQPRSARSVGSA